MAKTISANQGSVYLSSTADNPLYILAGVTVSAASQAVYNNHYNSESWTVTNQGTISSTNSDGVYLYNGGTVTNSGTAARILGGQHGIYINHGVGTVTNDGTIVGSSLQGVRLFAGGTVTNSGTAASISGGAVGVLIANGAGVVTNQGTINGASGNALYLGVGGTVTNSGTSALISGAHYAIFAQNAPATIFNQGTLTGSSLGGVSLYDGGLVTNSGTAARISGGDYGVFAKGSLTTVINQGTVAGSLSIGVYLGFGGNVTNSGPLAVIAGAGYGILAGGVGDVVTNQGTISASGTNGTGVKLLGGGTLTNAGTIIGAADAVSFGAGQAELLVIDPGVVFAGKVDGGNTIGATATSVLELASGASSGTLAGVGSQYINFAAIDVDAGAKWVLAGANKVGASASIDVAGGASLEVAGTLLAGATLTLGGTGNLLVDAGGAVEVGSSTDAIAGQVVVDADGTLFYTGYVSLGTVLNQGAILGSDRSGVYLRNGGIVTNSGTAAIISGPNYGIFAGGSTPTTVINQGTVAGTISVGVYLHVGGVVTNSGTAAVIAGAGDGIFAGGVGGVITNQGTISASGTAGVGVKLLGGGTLSNAGTISGAADAVRFAAGHAGLLVVDPGAVFAGKVDGGNAIGATAASVLELASAASSGTLSGLGSRYVNFATTDVDAGAKWVLAGANTLGASASIDVGGSASLEVAGTLLAGATLTLGGTGNLLVDAGGAVEVGSSTDAIAGQVVVDANSTLFYTGYVSLGTVLNQGAILGSDRSGVYLGNGGIVTNSGTAAIITGGTYGVYAKSGAATVTNQGTITASRDGVYFYDGGTVTNSGTAASISGGSNGIFGASVVTNAGTISATSGTGVRLVSGGLLTNSGTAARISGGSFGVFAGGLGMATVTNEGTISGTAYYGVFLREGGTLTNSGNIAGNTDAVLFASGRTGRLVVEPGAAFSGAVDGGNTIGAAYVSTLELASGASSGTLSGLGSQYINFATTDVDAGAKWVLAGANTVGASASIDVAGGASLEVAGTLLAGATLTLGGTGTLAVDGTGIVEVGTAGIASAGQLVVDAGDTLITGGTVSVSNILNQGTISGPSRDGVYLGAGGTLTNSGTSALISGGVYAIFAPNGAATISNQGSIYGTAAGGVYLGDGGMVTNSGTAARLAGQASGVITRNVAVTVANQGTIAGQSADGVDLFGGGTVTNSGGAVISSGGYGVLAANFAATIANQGTIAGQFEGGVKLTDGGLVANNGTAAGIVGAKYGVYATGNEAAVTNQGTISAASGVGVFLGAGGTVTDSGLIAGSKDAVLFAAASGGRLMIEPGATFSGAVDGGNTASALELVSAGTLSGIGEQFVNFGSIAFDAGAAWLIAGNTAGLAAGQTIAGFALGDTIELTGFVATSDSVTATGLVLTGPGGSETIGIQGALGSGPFVVTNDGTNSFVELACFAAGTRISAERGEIPVEQLRVGEMLSAHFGDDKMLLQPIEWIGRRTIDCRRHRRPVLVWPVRIRAGAFGPARPRRDLYLSPDHAVLVDDVLIPIKYLINGTTIKQVPTDDVTYYHVELPRHGVLYAEGMPAESYLATADGFNFANSGGAVALHPDFSTLRWEAAGYAPLIVSGPRLEAVRRLVNGFVVQAEAVVKPAAA